MASSAAWRVGWYGMQWHSISWNVMASYSISCRCPSCLCAYKRTYIAQNKVHKYVWWHLNVRSWDNKIFYIKICSSQHALSRAFLDASRRTPKGETNGLSTPNVQKAYQFDVGDTVSVFCWRREKKSIIHNNNQTANLVYSEDTFSTYQGVVMCVCVWGGGGRN